MTSDFQICQYDNSYGFPGKKPRFFKIILQDTIKEGRLEIPSGFVKKFGNCLWSPIVLKVPTGNTWQVELSKIGDEAWLEKGWQEFLEHHSLGHGHLLVFKYVGDYRFNVSIFDMSAVEIEYPENGKSQAHMKEIKEAQSRDENILHSDCPIQEFGGNLASRPLQSEFFGALEVANSFTSSNPWFKVVFKQTRVNQHSLWIPQSFVKKHMLFRAHNVMLKVEDKPWSVRLKVYLSNRTAALATGWSAFARDNSVKEGDVCVFELIDKKMFNVSIFRHLR